MSERVGNAFLTQKPSSLLAVHIARVALNLSRLADDMGHVMGLAERELWCTGALVLDESQVYDGSH